MKNKELEKSPFKLIEAVSKLKDNFKELEIDLNDEIKNKSSEYCISNFTKEELTQECLPNIDKSLKILLKKIHKADRNIKITKALSKGRNDHDLIEISIEQALEENIVEQVYKLKYFIDTLFSVNDYIIKEDVE